MRVLAITVVLGLVGCGGVDPAEHDGGRDGADASRLDGGPDAADRDASSLDASVLDAGPPPVRSTDFAEASGDVRNPDRGFYWWDWNDESPLVLVKLQLGDHCGTATLPAAAIADARARLEGHRDAGQRVILRSVYADGGDLNGCRRADAESIAIVEGHVAQLAPVYAEFADVIAYVEAGYFGMWGEWNSEHAPAGTALWESQDNRRRVLRALLDVVPEELAILVRRPRFRDELPFPAADLARIGFHDDCYLASATDYGTYEPPRTPDEWRDYIRAATPIVPIGGETCHDEPAFTACPNALADLERLRFDYLHEGYSTEVIDRWRSEGCLDEIRERLGYRLVLRAVEAPAQVVPGGTMRVRLELENLGFAPPRSTRRIRVILRGADGTLRATLTPREPVADSRTWMPGTIAPLELVVDLPDDLAAGEHEVRIALLDDRSDAPAYALVFANDDRVRDDARRENVVARVVVE